jgi:inhibitor of cysteine peptidase
MFTYVKLIINSGVAIFCIVLILTHTVPVLAAESVPIVPMQLQQGKLISVQIPQLDSGLPPESMSRLNEVFRQVVFQQLQSFETVAFQTRLINSMPETIKSSLTFMAEYEVFRVDSQIISLTQRVYQYTGGAHGRTIQTGHTIDRMSGRHLNLPDLFVTGANYAERMNRFVREEGRARQLPMWDFKGIGAQSAFYLSDTGVVLFFQQYEIAPYSAGIIQMQVPYELLTDILQPGIAR